MRVRHVVLVGGTAAAIGTAVVVVLRSWVERPAEFHPRPMQPTPDFAPPGPGPAQPGEAVPRVINLVGTPSPTPGSRRLFRYTNGVAVGSGADVKAVYSRTQHTPAPKQLIASKIPLNRTNPL